MDAESSLTSKGQVTIPAALRRKLGLRPGDRVAFAPVDAGTYDRLAERAERGEIVAEVGA